MDKVDLLDKLCDELDSRGIEGNVIERDILNCNPYVVIWPGKFEDRATVLTEELFFVHICADRYYEVLPSAKYRRYFGERFWSCRSEKRGYYIMTFLKLVDTIEYLFKKENNMNNSRTEATRELCNIIAYEADKSPLRWTDVRDDSAEVKYASTYGCNSIYIYNLSPNTNTDTKVCKVRIYVNSLRCSKNDTYYYVYFTDKYSSVAKDIKDPRIAGITDADGYKFVSPRHVIDFVREVVRWKERGGVLKDCKREIVDRIERTRGCGKTAFQMYQYYREVLGMLDTINPDSIEIEDVIFNDPATIVKWSDGTKTVVKAENEEFDPEKGLAMAISKRVLGNRYDYYDIFKKYVGRYEKKQKKGKK